MRRPDRDGPGRDVRDREPSRSDARTHRVGRTEQGATIAPSSRFSMNRSSVPSVPRRWSTEIEGYRWIPRMADKARMRDAGTMGDYLMGQSPVDKSLLRVLGLNTDAWVELVRGTSDDAEVLARLRARGLDEARLRRWSETFPTRFKALIPLWDLDEGHVAPTPLQRVALAVLQPAVGPLMALYRRISPAP